MGFKNGAYAKVFQVEKKSDNNVVLRIAISKKNKMTGEYEQDFSGYVSCIGTSAVNKAMSLKIGDRIKLGDLDVSNRYDKEKNMTYTNYKMFSFEIEDGTNSKSDAVERTVENLEEKEEIDNEKLPF